MDSSLSDDHHHHPTPIRLINAKSTLKLGRKYKYPHSRTYSNWPNIYSALILLSQLLLVSKTSWPQAGCAILAVSASPLANFNHNQQPASPSPDLGLSHDELSHSRSKNSMIANDKQKPTIFMQTTEGSGNGPLLQQHNPMSSSSLGDYQSSVKQQRNKIHWHQHSSSLGGKQDNRPDDDDDDDDQDDDDQYDTRDNGSGQPSPDINKNNDNKYSVDENKSTNKKQSMITNNDKTNLDANPQILPSLPTKLAGPTDPGLNKVENDIYKPFRQPASAIDSSITSTASSNIDIAIGSDNNKLAPIMVSTTPLPSSQAPRQNSEQPPINGEIKSDNSLTINRYMAQATRVPDSSSSTTPAIQSTDTSLRPEIKLEVADPASKPIANLKTSQDKSRIIDDINLTKTDKTLYQNTISTTESPSVANRPTNTLQSRPTLSILPPKHQTNYKSVTTQPPFLETTNKRLPINLVGPRPAHPNLNKTSMTIEEEYDEETDDDDSDDYSSRIFEDGDPSNDPKTTSIDSNYKSMAKSPSSTSASMTTMGPTTKDGPSSVDHQLDKNQRRPPVDSVTHKPSMAYNKTNHNDNTPLSNSMNINTNRSHNDNGSNDRHKVPKQQVTNLQSFTQNSDSEPSLVGNTDIGNSKTNEHMMSRDRSQYRHPFDSIPGWNSPDSTPTTRNPYVYRHPFDDDAPIVSRPPIDDMDRDHRANETADVDDEDDDDDDDDDDEEDEDEEEEQDNSNNRDNFSNEQHNSSSSFNDPTGSQTLAPPPQNGYDLTSNRNPNLYTTEQPMYKASLDESKRADNKPNLQSNFITHLTTIRPTITNNLMPNSQGGGVPNVETTGPTRPPPVINTSPSYHWDSESTTTKNAISITLTTTAEPPTAATTTKIAPPLLTTSSPVLTPPSTQDPFQRNHYPGSVGYQPTTASTANLPNLTSRNNDNTLNYPPSTRGQTLSPTATPGPITTSTRPPFTYMDDRDYPRQPPPVNSLPALDETDLTRQIYDKLVGLIDATKQAGIASWDFLVAAKNEWRTMNFEPLISQPLILMFALGAGVITIVLLMMLIVYIITCQIRPRVDYVDEEDDDSIF